MGADPAVRLVLLAVLTVVFFCTAVTSVDSFDPAITLAPNTRIEPSGAVAGGDALWLPHGDILNVRNVQGGTVDDPNLDLGAGSSTHRGTLALNYDVGRCTVISNGHKHPLAVFCPGKRPWFRRAPRVGGRPPR
jgi:hypothetical protein